MDRKVLKSKVRVTPDEFSDWKFSPAGFFSQSCGVQCSWECPVGGQGKGIGIVPVSRDVAEWTQSSGAWAVLAESETPIITVPAMSYDPEERR